MSGSTVSRQPAYPPETIEGWYALHQIFQIDRGAGAALSEFRSPVFDGTDRDAAAETGGWSVVARLIGSTADVMFIHFRPTLDEIGDAQQKLAREPWMGSLHPAYSFLSVTEAGLYHTTADLARDARARGGQVGDEAYAAEVHRRTAEERNNPHVRRRLYPSKPTNTPYVCFYPMSKRRNPGQNWYTLALEARSFMMRDHGLTGRRYAGRVQQVITGAIGLDAWEWGVTLFAADPLEFKKLVTDMRFDEVSAEYAEFGNFYVGKLADGA